MWSSYRDRARAVVRVALVLAGLPGAALAQVGVAGEAAPGAADAPGAHPFAAASAYGAYAASHARVVDRRADGRVVSETETRDDASLGVIGRVGVAWNTASTASRLAGQVAAFVRPDESVGRRNLTLGLDARTEDRLAARWTLGASAGVFEGVRQSELALGAEGGASGVAGGASAAGATGEATPSTDAGRRLLFETPYLRGELGLSLDYVPTPRWRHRFGGQAAVLVFPDEAAVRAAGERLFDTYTFGPEYALTYGPRPGREYILEASERTTSFRAVGSTSSDAAAASGAVGTGLDQHVLTSRAGLRFDVTPFWALEAFAGGGATLAPGGTAPVQVGFVGSAGLVHRDRGGLERLDVERRIHQSEVGAMFAESDARLSAQRAVGRRALVTASVAGTRYDVITQVFASQADLEAAAARLPGENVTEAQLAARARRAAQGYGLDSGLNLALQFSEYFGMSLGYGYERRWSDDPDRGDQAVHRVLAGLSLTSEPVTLADAPGEN